MTEYELFEVFNSYQALLHDWTTTYFSAVTAYLVAAYTIGAKLNRSQALITTACFVIFSASCIYAATADGIRMVDLTNEIRAMNPRRQFLVNMPILLVAMGVQWVGLFVALKFMWDVRHPRTD